MITWLKSFFRVKFTPDLGWLDREPITRQAQLAIRADQEVPEQDIKALQRMFNKHGIDSVTRVPDGPIYIEYLKRQE